MFRLMVLVTVFLNTFAEANLQCLYCSEAVSPTDCDTVIRCGEHEMCGTSPNVRKREVSFMTTHGNTQTASDSLMFSKVKRTLWPGTKTISSKRSNDLLICSECCTGNLCGSAGCGYKGYYTPRGPICFNCAEQLTPGDCSNIKQCGQGEVCMLLKTLNPISHEVRYKTECSTEKSCQNEIQNFNEIAALFVGRRRRRQYHLEIGESCLVQCCTTDMCNLNCGNNTYFNSNATPGIASSQTKNPAPTTSIQSSARSSTEQGIKHTHVSASTYIQTTAIRSTYRAPQPVTPSTTLNYQTPKLPQTTNTDGCIYNGFKYNLGEYWYNGCIEKCFCVNGSTGEFQCTARCPTYTSMSSACRMVTIPGQCCQEPRCNSPTQTSIATPIIPTVAPSITGCEDAIPNCAAYGQTSCRAPYGKWAQQNCRAYCNLCSHNQSPLSYQCMDKLQNCNAYEASLCTGVYEPWARENCRKTCNLCSTPAPRIVTHYPSQTLQACSDKLSNCAFYDKRTACEGIFEQWAIDNCQKYCDKCTASGNYGTTMSVQLPNTTAFCIYKSKIYNQGEVWQDGCQYNCTCEDARIGFYRCQDLCPVWKNLPAGCTMEKKPGACCSQPNCGGQTLTPGDMANTCFYGGKYYHQGDQWRDGCKYKCTCQDGKTGFYQCQTLCLQWTLPSSCRLDPPPAGKCCEVPVCPSNVQIQYPPGFVQE